MTTKASDHKPLTDHDDDLNNNKEDRTDAHNNKDQKQDESKEEEKEMETPSYSPAASAVKETEMEQASPAPTSTTVAVASVDAIDHHVHGIMPLPPRSRRTVNNSVPGAHAVQGPNARNNTATITNRNQTDGGADGDLEVGIINNMSPYSFTNATNHCRHCSGNHTGTTDHSESDGCLVEAELVVEEDSGAHGSNHHAGSANNREGGNLRVSNTLYAKAEPVTSTVSNKKWKMAAAILVILTLVIIIPVVTVTLVLVNNNKKHSHTSNIPTNNITNIVKLTPSNATIPYHSPIMPGWAPNGDRESPPFATSQDGKILAVAYVSPQDAQAAGTVLTSSTGTVRVYQKTLANNGEDVWWEPLGNPIVSQQNDDNFAFHGVALSADGTRLAVGAHKANVAVSMDDNNTEQIRHVAGRIHVYDLVLLVDNNEYEWREVQRFLVSPHDNDGVSNAIATTNDNATSTATTITMPLVGLETDDQFGKEVAMSHDGTILAGSSYTNTNDNGDKNAGNIMIFRQDDNNQWQPMGQVLVGQAPHERLGRSLALSASGQRLAAGAIQSKNSGPGMVLVLDFNGTKWNQVGQTLHGDSLPDVFGRDVTLSDDGSILAVGANQANVSGVKDLGMVRVFQLQEIEIDSPNDDDDDDDEPYTATATTSQQQWVQLGQDILGQTVGDRMGTSISMSGNGRRLAVGASQRDTGVGYIQLFEYNIKEDRWIQINQSAVEGDSTSWAKVGTELTLSNNGKQLVAGGVGNLNSDGHVAARFQVFDL